MEKMEIIEGLNYAKVELVEYIEVCTTLKLKNQLQKTQQMLVSVEEAIHYIEEN